MLIRGHRFRFITPYTDWSFRNNRLTRTQNLLCPSNSFLWSRYILILHSSSSVACEPSGETWEMPRRSLLKMIGDEAAAAVFLIALSDSPAVSVQPRWTFALSFLGFSLEFKPLFYSSPWQELFYWLERHIVCSWNCITCSANIMPFCFIVLALNDL